MGFEGNTLGGSDVNPAAYRPTAADKSAAISVAIDAALSGRDDEAARVLSNVGITVRQNVLATCGRPQVGDVLSCGWGYEQTRYDFYQVVKVTAKSVQIREIGKTYVTVGVAGQATVVPVKGQFVGASMTKRYRGDYQGIGYYCNVTSYSSARLWDGAPQHESGEH